MHTHYSFQTLQNWHLCIVKYSLIVGRQHFVSHQKKYITSIRFVIVSTIYILKTIKPALQRIAISTSTTLQTIVNQALSWRGQYLKKITASEMKTRSSTEFEKLLIPISCLKKLLRFGELNLKTYFHIVNTQFTSTPTLCQCKHVRVSVFK